MKQVGQHKTGKHSVLKLEAKLPRDCEVSSFDLILTADADFGALVAVDISYML